MPLRPITKLTNNYSQIFKFHNSKVEVMEQYLLIVIERAFLAAPLNLQSLKKQSMSWVYKYEAQQYLKYGSKNFTDLKLATKKLMRAIWVQPKILLEEYTQGLIRHLVKSWVAIPFNNHTV